jgi:hypothetical protein
MQIHILQQPCVHVWKLGNREFDLRVKKTTFKTYRLPTIVIVVSLVFGPTHLYNRSTTLSWCVYCPKYLFCWLNPNMSVVGFTFTWFLIYPTLSPIPMSWFDHFEGKHNLFVDEYNHILPFKILRWWLSREQNYPKKTSPFERTKPCVFKNKPSSVFLHWCPRKNEGIFTSMRRSVPLFDLGSGGRPEDRNSSCQ